MSSPRVDVDGVLVSPDHYINGERIASSRTFEDRSPLDWTWKLADVARAGSVEADLAVTAAEAAFPAWASLSVKERSAYLDRLADLIDRDVDAIAHVECLDMAMLEESLRLRVIGRGARNFRAYAELARNYEPRRWSSNGTANTVLRMPAGPTVVITPWNAPFMLSTWKCAPALAAGNTVIAKPAEMTPLTAIRIGELAAQAGIPDGVLQVLPGKGSVVGQRLVGHPAVRKIVFTGSTEVGRQVMAGCARQVKRLTLELGGKSANIVFADSDLEQAAATAPYAVFDNAGQDCCARSRVLVEASVFDRFTALFEEHVRAIRVGDPLDPATEMGPLISAAQRDAVASFLDDGDPVVCRGSAPEGPGFWFAPTVLAPVEPNARAAREEIFGPIAAVIPFADEADAVRLANDTIYGLSGSVWTRDGARALRMTRAIETGVISVNSNTSVRVTTPFGGFKQSGYGRELGPHALDAYTEVKSIFFATG